MFSNKANKIIETYRGQAIILQAKERHPVKDGAVILLVAELGEHVGD